MKRCFGGHICSSGTNRINTQKCPPPPPKNGLHSFIHTLCRMVCQLSSNIIGTSGQRSSRSAFGRSTGNDVSGHNNRHHLFSLVLSSVLYFLHSKSWRECPKTYSWTPFQTPSAILGPPGGRFGFCSWLARVPGAARMVFFYIPCTSPVVTITSWD